MATFRITDMTCGHCASAIARAVASVDKDARLEISIRDKLVRVSSTASSSELVAAIADAGYAAEAEDTVEVPAPSRPGGCCCGSRKAAQGDRATGRERSGGACC
jgi:copper chaperone